ncbi:hypothetical protein LX36DRAFT_737821, partial [Colletotrichum falcatum]
KLIAEELWKSVLECVLVHPIYKSCFWGPFLHRTAPVLSKGGTRMPSIRLPYFSRTDLILSYRHVTCTIVLPFRRSHPSVGLQDAVPSAPRAVRWVFNPVACRVVTKL